MAGHMLTGRTGGGLEKDMRLQVLNDSELGSRSSSRNTSPDGRDQSKSKNGGQRSSPKKSSLGKSGAITPTPGRSAHGSRYKLEGLSDFNDPVYVEAFLCKIANDLMMLSEKPTQIFKTQSVDRVASMRQALSILEATAEDLHDMEKRARGHVQFCQEETDTEESRFLTTVDTVQTALNTAGADFRRMDATMSSLTTSATTIGARLGTAHRINKLAGSTEQLLQHMWDFSQIPPGCLQRGNLMELQDYVDRTFYDDARLSEAAEWMQRMLPVAKDLHSSNLRLGLAGTDAEVVTPGTIEATLRNMVAYRNQLQNRLVERFHDASSMHGQNVALMAECAHNLAHFGAEEAAVQGYIAMLPLFSNPTTSLDFRRDTEDLTESMQSIVQSLEDMFDDLLQVIRGQLQVFKHVFTNWQVAFHTFVTRVLEEKVLTVLQDALEPPTPSTADKLGEVNILESYLKMLMDSHAKLMTFCNTVDSTMPLKASVRETTEALFAISLQGYQQTEQRWLALNYAIQSGDDIPSESKAPTAKETAFRLYSAARNLATGSGASSGSAKDLGMSEKLTMKDSKHRSSKSEIPGQLSLKAIEQQIEWNCTVMDRCQELITSATNAQHIAVFFSRSVDTFGPCCLLEQVARHLLQGLAVASQAAAEGLKITVTTGGTKTTSATVYRAVEDYISAGPRIVLMCVQLAARGRSALMRHWAQRVKPCLVRSPANTAECYQALDQLVHAVEQRTLSALTACLDGFEAQVSKVLATEQKKGDFQPDEDNLELDSPTTACMLVVGVIRSLAADVTEYMVGSSRASFLSEMGIITKELLTAHMLKFSFSMCGALQWKRDMADYDRAVRTFGLSKVDESFDHLLLLCNILIVHPETLLDLVEGSLRMDRADAWQYIKLREDYRTTRVDGLTLQHVFQAQDKV